MSKHVPTTTKFPQWIFLDYTKRLPPVFRTLQRTIAGHTYTAYRDGQNKLHVIGETDASRQQQKPGVRPFITKETAQGCWIDIATPLITQYFDPPHSPELAQRFPFKQEQRHQYLTHPVATMRTLLAVRHASVQKHVSTPLTVTHHAPPNDLQGEATYVYNGFVVDHKYWLPFTSLLVCQADDGHTIVVWDSLAPVDTHECVVFTTVARNYDSSDVFLLCPPMPYATSTTENQLAQQYERAMHDSFPDLLSYLKGHDDDQSIT